MIFFFFFDSELIPNLTLTEILSKVICLTSANDTKKFL